MKSPTAAFSDSMLDKAQLTPTDPFNLHYNYGNADYDVRQNFTGSYVYYGSILAWTPRCDRWLANYGHRLPP